MRVGDAGDGGDAALQLLRHAQVRGPVVADGPHIDLRRQAEIEDLRDDVGRLEIERHVGKGGGQHLAQLAHVVGGRRVAVFQRHQDHAVIDADGRAVGEGEIVGARRQADIVDDQLAVALGDDLADLVLDGLEDTPSVASMRVPAGARTCSWICPPSMSGKKSRPTSESITPPSASTRTAAMGTMSWRVRSKPQEHRHSPGACARSRARSRHGSATNQFRRVPSARDRRDARP